MDGEEGVIFTPGAFERHDAALSYVNRLARSRRPVGRSTRFPRAIAGAWGLLASGSSLSACSGTTLGTGTVKLCDREGTVAEDAEDVEVANAGGAITASGGDLIVPLEWTDGEWSACSCVSVPSIVCPNCDACGGVRLALEGTVTDDNGTVAIAWDESTGFWRTVPFALTWPDAPVGQDGCVAGPEDFDYGYFFRCTDEGGFQVIRTGHTAYVTLDSPPAFIGYNLHPITGFTCDSFPTSTQYNLESQDCAGLTVTFNFVTVLGTVFPPDPDAIVIPQQSSSATFNIPIEYLPPSVCCNPCPIPKSDLTLTIGSGSPHVMEFNGTDEWQWSAGATVVTLKCTSGHATLTGMGPPLSCSLSSCTSSPFHLDFLCGGTHYYVDGP